MNATDKHHKIRGILFDKDGTLIDFNSIWIPLAFELTNQLLDSCAAEKMGSEHKKILLQRIGIRADGSVIPGSIYASGTQDDFADILYRSARELGFCLPQYDSFLEEVSNQVKSYMFTHRHFIRPVPKAYETLAALAKMGFILGVSTSDSEENTRFCLGETEMLQYFSYIGCPSRCISPKPSGDIFQDFMDRFELTPQEIAVVGDTSVDIAFAKSNHAALAIGVLNGTGKKEELSEDADILLPTIAGLIRNGDPIWNFTNRSDYKTITDYDLEGEQKL